MIGDNPLSPRTGKPILSQGNVYTENANGTRGPICHKGWGIEEVRKSIFSLRLKISSHIFQANVACREAGFSEGAWAFSTWHNYFPRSSGTLNETMTNVNCTGNETSLLQCDYDVEPDEYWCRGNYLYRYIAGVFCKGEKKHD